MRRRLWILCALGGMVAAAYCMTTTFGVARAAGVQSARVELLPSDAHGNPIAGESYYHVKAGPGRTVREYAKVGNTGGRAGRVTVLPVDGASALYGGVSYRLPGQPRHEVGAWTKVRRTKVWLRAGQSVVVPFTVHVPRGLKPGQYVGGMTAFVPTPGPKRAKFAVLNVQLRVVSAIVVQVPGPTHAAFTISGVSTKYQPTGVFAGVRIRNSGGRLLLGHGRLSVRKVGDNTPIINKSFLVDTMVPHTAISYPIPWKPKPGYGQYQARATLTWKGGSTTWNHTFRVGPPPPRPRPNQPGGKPAKSQSSALGMSAGAIAGIIVLVIGVVMLSAIIWRRRASRRTGVPRLGLDPMGREPSVPYAGR